jgi:hypothetical protein
MHYIVFGVGMLRNVLLIGMSAKPCIPAPWTGVHLMLLTRPTQCLLHSLCVWSHRYYLGVDVKLFKPVAVIQEPDLPCDFMDWFSCRGTWLYHCFRTF